MPCILASVHARSDRARSRLIARANRLPRVLASLLCVLGGALPAMSPAFGATEPGSSQDLNGSEQVVFVGVGGLSWSDVSPATTPTLSRLLTGASAAALSVRTVQLSTCPADGWLAVNAGARAAVPDPGQGDRCADIAAVPRGGGADVPGWARIGGYNAQFSYDPQFGLLAAAAAPRGCATAVGPGAAMALADEQGHVQRYVSTLAQADLSACPLTVIDLGSLRLPPGPSRTTAVRAVDAALGRVVATAPRAQLLVAGLSDSSFTPHLQAVLASGTAYRGGWLTASSTRHVGLVQLTDLTPTILAGLGVDAPSRAVGSVLRQASGRPADTAVALQRLRDPDVAAQTINANVTQFFWLVAIGAVLAAGLFVVARRAEDSQRTGLGQVARLLGSAFAALPVASFLSNLAPWWRWHNPGVALWTTVLAWSVLIGVLAVAGPWRRQAFGPAGFVAVVTASVLAVDVVTGSRLQLSSLWGLSPLDAGRFYGFGNVAFAVFATTALIAAGWAASAVRLHGRRRAAACVAAIGVAAVAVDGWPSFGADFGGVLALVPGFALLAAGIGGLRVTPRRAVAVAGATVAVASAIALLDWSRPPGDRTHLGRLVQQIIDGEVGAVLRRKVDANLHQFTERPAVTVLVLALLIAAAVAVVVPQRIRRSRAVAVYNAEPSLRPCLAACLLTTGIGLALNDSGIIIPAVALAVGLPLATSIYAATLPTSPPH